ncbi:MAG: hypothetical protein D3918_15095 [Candidatus Electrothrix sp. AX2]|nr:hypothetical protein [Candidatus Electrothrix gigas]
MQHLLFQPLLKGETVALDRALERISEYRATQTEQSASSADDLDKYLQRIALEVYSRALSDTELQLLRLLTLFDFPVPEELLLQAGPKIGIADPATALQRLDNFGLVNHWSEKGLEEHISCYGLAEKVVEPLGREDRNFLAKICAPLLWRIWFKDFLEDYAVPETETLRESADFLGQVFAFLHICPVCQVGQLPLSGKTDQRRIAALHQLCIRNSLADWEKIGFKEDAFINSLELSLSLNVFEKIAASSAVLEKLSTVRFEEWHKFFSEDRIKWKKQIEEHSQSVLADIFQQFAGNSELLRQAYSLYFGEPDIITCNILKEADFADKENRLQTALQLAKTDKEKAIACGNYAYFLENQKHDYAAAEMMHERAVEADPSRASNLGNYAVFLANQKQENYTIAESTFQKAVENDPKHANNLGNYAYFLENQKHDYVAAEMMYQRAVEADPNHGNNLGNYANFLSDQKHDCAAAEAMYKRAVEADPYHARNLGSYAVFLANQKKENHTVVEAIFQRAVVTVSLNSSYKS